MLSGIHSHFPRFIPAEKVLFQVLKLDVLFAVVEDYVGDRLCSNGERRLDVKR